MSSLGRWKIVLLGAGLALSAGCNLGDLLDEEALLDKFKGIQIPQAGVEQAHQVIGEQGGQVATANGAVSIPEGALGDDVDISVEQADTTAIVAPLPSVMKPVSAPVSFKPDGTKFDEPVTLSLFHDKSAVEPEQPVVVWLESEKDPNWKTMPQEDTQTDQGVTYVSTTHFSVYAVVDCRATGALAHLCQDLLDGKITIADVLEAAPPSDDTWGGVIDTGNDGGDDPDGDPGTTTKYDCATCLGLAQVCTKDPRAAECQAAAQPCMALAASCVDDEPPTRCEDLGRRCQGGDQNACSALQRECGSAQPDCTKLSAGCEGGDARACEQYDAAGCGDGSISDCDSAALLCESGNQDACAYYDGFCNQPVEDCVTASQECDSGDQTACDYYNLYCVSDSEDCQLASAMCEGGDGTACEIYQRYCTGSIPDVSDCQAYSDACYVGDQDACNYYQLYCTDVPADCESLYVDCMDNLNQQSCDSYEVLCLGDDPNCQYEPVCTPAGCDVDVCWDESCHEEYTCKQPSECDLARENCDLYQDAEACAFVEANCVPVVDPGPCEQLDYDCHVNEIAEACAAFEAQCTGSGPDCKTLFDGCQRGDEASCTSFNELGCPPPPDGPPDGGVPPPPADECGSLYDACMGGDDISCTKFDDLGCPPPPALP
jgi:hypothetical protein